MPTPGVGVCARTDDEKTAESKTAASSFPTITSPAGVVSRTPGSGFGPHFIAASGSHPRTMCAAVRGRSLSAGDRAGSGYECPQGS